MGIEVYKCSNCGGAVAFDLAEQKMICKNCRSSFEIRADEKTTARKDADGHDDEQFFDISRNDSDGGAFFDISRNDSDDGAFFDISRNDPSGAENHFEVADAEEIVAHTHEVWENPDADGIASGACPTCAAEFYGDHNTVATVCPCCGNAQIIPKQFAGQLRPDYIVPFKIDKGAAVEAVKKFAADKKLLPDDFLSVKKITEIQGVYAPFWVFNAAVDTSMEYHCVKRETRGDKTSDYHYKALRNGRVEFENVQLDASKKMNNAYMDALSPFADGEKTPFHPSYLAGYLAERYDEDLASSRERANMRIVNTFGNDYGSTLSEYHEHHLDNGVVDIRHKEPEYALFPVWVLNVKYDYDNYQYMMSGLTGKIVGELPTDERKARKIMLKRAGVWGTGWAAVVLFIAALVFAVLSDEDAQFYESVLFMLPPVMLFTPIYAYRAWKSVKKHMESLRDDMDNLDINTDLSRYTFGAWRGVRQADIPTNDRPRRDFSSWKKSTPAANTERYTYA